MFACSPLALAVEDVEDSTGNNVARQKQSSKPKKRLWAESFTQGHAFDGLLEPVPQRYVVSPISTRLSLSNPHCRDRPVSSCQIARKTFEPDGI